MCEVAPAPGTTTAARAEECNSPFLRRRFIPICPALRWERFDMGPAGARVGAGGALLVARDRGQPCQVLQQDAAALQIEDAVLAPGLQLPVDALARGADEDAELFLRNVHLGTEIIGQRAKSAGEPDRQRLQHGFFHPLALPANAVAQKLDDLDRDLRLALKEAHEILPAQHEEFGRLARSCVRRAELRVEDGDFSEQVAGSHEIQRQATAVGGTGLNADLAAADPEQRVSGITLLEQDFTGIQMLRVTEI